MRLSLVCAGIAIAMLAAACDKKEKVAAPLLPVPECKAAQDYDPVAFERMVRAMDRSGDLVVVVNRFQKHRKVVEEQLGQRDPALLPRLKPVLDAQFSEARLRDRAACVFVELSGETEGVKLLDAWSRSPGMQAINRAIWTRTPGPSKEPDIQMTPQRQAILHELAVAMALQQVETNNNKVNGEGIPALVAIFSPAPPPPPVPTPDAVPATDMAPGAAPAATPAPGTSPLPTATPVAGAAPAPTTAPGTPSPPTAMPVTSAAPAPTAVPGTPQNATPVASTTPAPPATTAPGMSPTATPVAGTAPPPPATAVASNAAPAPAPAPQALTVNTADLSVILNRWLTPALVKVPDEQLAKFVAFANTSFGANYYVALSRAHDFQAGEWYAQTAKKFTDNIPPVAAAAGAPGSDVLVADARHALRNDGSPAAAAYAAGKLLEADRIDPRNPEIQTLLGEAAMKTAPGMPLAPDQLRVVIETPNYEQAEKYFLRAIELSPEYADAHMLLGRLRFLQGRDEEAAQSFARAIDIEHEHPNMDLFLGDLAYVKKDYNVAYRHYKAAIAKPERLAYVHVNALSHLLMTLRKGTQMAEYPRIAEGYLAKYPQAWNFRLDYADFLISADTRADKIFAVADPIPDTWLPARKVPIISSALVRKAGERVDRAGEPREESMALIQRAMGMNPDPVTLAESICRAGAKSKLVRRTYDVNKDQKRLATALTVCGLRWQRHDIVREMSLRADTKQLNLPLVELGGDTPLCYAAATKNLAGFGALVEAQVSPVRKCRDGNTVAERLLQMSFARDPNVAQMQIMMKRFYKKS
ncbi:MAG: tetratricopeptide repeat protein [Lysobacter sp.]|nr:tetratricopeptide repeat protein [Lysobacter sp.]